MKRFIKMQTKRALRYSAALTMVGTVVCGLWSSSLSANDLVPYKETAQAAVTYRAPDGSSEVIEGTGNATHMGLVSVRAELSLQDMGIADDPDYGLAYFVEISGTLETTAANGDKLFSDINALYIVPAEQPGHFLAYIEGTVEVTGGTKRFENATGSMSLQGTDEAVEGMTQSLISLEVRGMVSSVGTNKK